MKAERNFGDRTTTVFWDNDSILELINGDPLYAPYASCYLAAEKLAMRSDIARYVIMHRYGGLYLDADYTLQKDADSDALATILDALGKRKQLMLPVYRLQVCALMQRMLVGKPFDKTVTNDMIFAPSPGHQIFIEMLDHIAANIKQRWGEIHSLYVLKTSGPLALSAIVHEHKDDIGLVDLKTLLPLISLDPVETIKWRKENNATKELAETIGTQFNYFELFACLSILALIITVIVFLATIK